MWGQKRQRRILIVEDDENNHPLFRDAFSAAGFTVTLCRSAEDDFVEEVIQVAPDIISMDLMIATDRSAPARDGFTAIELLQADERTQDVPIIVLSNFTTESKVAHAKALGAVDFISLQGQSITKIPIIYHRYLDSPKNYDPVHPLFRQ